MTSLAHPGIGLLFMVMAATIGCGASADPGGGNGNGESERTQVDASDPDACQVHTDCALIGRGCCGSCVPPPKTAVKAVRRSRLAEAQHEACPGDVACGPCWERTAYEPLAPQLKAACVAKRCEVVDLREEALTQCSTDADCTVRSAGCCPACGSDPSGYLGIRRDADTSLLACDPIPPCAPCTESSAAPEAFCAADGHCAVKGKGRLAGLPSGTCYAPIQNLLRAYDPGAVGCDCAATDPAVCAMDDQTRSVALVCGAEQRWTAVEDGPCAHLFR